MHKCEHFCLVYTVGIELLDHRVNCMLSFSRYCQVVFQSGCISFHSHQQGSPIVTYPCQYLVMSRLFLSLAIFMGMSWCPIKVVIFILLMTYMTEHLSIHLMVIWAFSFMKWLFKSFEEKWEGVEWERKRMNGVGCSLPPTTPEVHLSLVFMNVNWEWPECLWFFPQTHLLHRENREHKENWSSSGLKVALGRGKGV